MLSIWFLIQTGGKINYILEICQDKVHRDKQMSYSIALMDLNSSLRIAQFSWHLLIDGMTVHANISGFDGH